MGDLTPLLEALSEDQPPVYPDSLFNGLNSITYDNHMGVLNSEYGTKDMFYSGSESHNLSPTISSTTPQSQALTGSTVTSTSQGNVGYSQPSASNVAPAATPHQGVSPTQAAVNTQATQGKMKESANSDTKLADYVVKCLKNYGICVVDNFLGSEIATELLKEVCVLDALGTMNDGLITTTVNNHVKNQSIRSDKIAWVEKGQDGHQYIGKLINRLDNLIMQCQGRLDKYRINGRTRAMVACYPGGGTLYKRHIDNPSGDGRCITCIYYLNKGWKVEEHGGLLRIFPESFQSKVADIEPIFDRQIFFWSDKRNPHEVQPSFKTRYAITVWYFDAEERAKAKLRYQIDQMAKAGAL
jgi:Rps23 Pro-64 3,4-dihydroxylase Tpa1-like proline 4-hydroxylase